MDDIHCYSIEHVRAQIERAQIERAQIERAQIERADAEGAMKALGFFEVRFYAAGGRPAREQTGVIETFFYYPSGGTIRDRDMNIVFYEPKLDKYHTSNREV